MLFIMSALKSRARLRIYYELYELYLQVLISASLAQGLTRKWQKFENTELKGK